MGIQKFITPFPWKRYSRKLRNRIVKPRNAGFFTQEGAASRGMKLVEGVEGLVSDGNSVRFFWLVDEEDGTIVDAKYQLFGQSALIGAAEVMCDLIVGKNYDQARRITTDLIDKELCDRGAMSAFPPETYAHLNLVIDAVENAAEQCGDIPLPTSYVAPPAPLDIGEVLEGGYPGFDTMSREGQVALIEQVLDVEVRPYIALDGGGLDLISFEGNRLEIAYQGNCVGCFSAVGATLSYIQQVVHAKVHPDIQVVPQL